MSRIAAVFSGRSAMFSLISIPVSTFVIPGSISVSFSLTIAVSVSISFSISISVAVPVPVSVSIVVAISTSVVVVVRSSGFSIARCNNLYLYICCRRHLKKKENTLVMNTETSISLTYAWNIFQLKDLGIK